MFRCRAMADRWEGCGKVSEFTFARYRCVRETWVSGRVEICKLHVFFIIGVVMNLYLLLNDMR